MRALRMILALGIAAVLAGCASDKPPRLMNVVSTGYGPDEFGILPPKGLSMPTDLTNLPTPTPGGSNLTDHDPEAEAIVALGGRPDAGVAGDAGLVSHASRHGTNQNIRATLANEDLEHRKENRGKLLERIFNVNTYYKAYDDQRLEQHSETWRWRRQGAKTPSAPPPKEDEVE